MFLSSVLAACRQAGCQMEEPGDRSRREVVSVVALGAWGGAVAGVVSTRPAPPRSPGSLCGVRARLGTSRPLALPQGTPPRPGPRHRHTTVSSLLPQGLHGAPQSGEGLQVQRQKGWPMRPAPLLPVGDSCRAPPWAQLAGAGVGTGLRRGLRVLGWAQEGNLRCGVRSRAEEWGPGMRPPTLGLNPSLIHLVSEPPAASVSPPASSAQPSTATATTSPRARVWCPALSGLSQPPEESDFSHLRTGPVTA